jgi:serine protease Do
MRRWIPAPFALAALTAAQAQTAFDYSPIVEQVAPSIVHVRVERPAPPKPERGAKAPDDETARFFERFAPQTRRPILGSGFILSQDGYVVTHAVEGEGQTPIKVTLIDGREFPAKLVGTDGSTDISLLKIEATGLRPVKFADMSKVKAGQRVLLVGSAFPGETTIADGIISQYSPSRAPGALPTAVPVVPYIATTVPVQAGNGGAPFVDFKGEVVGFVTQMYVSPGNPFATISFGVLPDAIRGTAESLRTFGYVPRGAIRITIQEVTKELADALGMPSPRGALVNAVEKGGPADRAGIATGDVILQFNGQAVQASSDIFRLVGAARIGSRARVQVLRKGELKDLEVEVMDLGKVPYKPRSR